MGTPELSVLKPIDASISDPDDYEIFTLSNAHVSYTSNGRPASLLAAYADTPLKVVGRLEAPDRGQMKYLVNRPFKPVDIEVRGVTRYSYGQTQDGETVIWALGEAGWFELRPSREYSEIYKKMTQAVEILYFVTDIYDELRKKGGGPGPSLILQEYAEDQRFECTDPDEAASIFHEHRNFLIMCFLGKAQGVSWSNTPLYQHYRRTYPKEWELIRARIDGKQVSPERGSKPAKSDSLPPPLKPQGRTRRTKEEKAAEAPKKDNNWWEAAAIFEFLQKAFNHGALRLGRITIERLAKLIVKRYEIEELEVAQNVILVHASNLSYMIKHPPRNKKSLQFLLEEPIYQELTAEHNIPAAEMRRASSVELRPRKDHRSRKDDITSNSDSSSEEEEEEIETPRRRPLRRKQGTLSVLRPRSSKYSGKGKGPKQGKGKGKAPPITPAAEESGEDDDNDNEEAAPDAASSNSSASDIEIDTPTHGLSPSKRKHTPDLLAATTDTNPRKRRASESPASSSGTSDQEETSTAAPLPLRWRPGNAPKSSSPAFLPPVVSSPLPMYTANAPGDSWLCTVDGCSQKVYGASTELGKGAIKEHLGDHARGRQREIGIILGEEQKLRLPVNNLIKKIREMSERQQPLFPSSVGSTPTAIRPAPIERKV